MTEPDNKVYTVIGVMCGTSMDAIDVALVRTDGKDFTKLVNFKSFDNDDHYKEAVRAVFTRTKEDDEVRFAEKVVTDAHIEAIKNSGFEADLIGCHGQSITHNPEGRFTWQLGDFQRIADKTGMDVIADLRQADIAEGGQGAPLLPLCHRAFASEAERPIAILNLGGVGNITYLGVERGDILAFDTGPANALIDDVVKAKTGRNYDSEGELALAGKVHLNMVDDWLKHPFFEKSYPKSLDRDEWEVRRAYDLPLEDAVATLATFTVQSVHKALKLLPDTPATIYVAGGGRKNKFIMRELDKIMPCKVEPVEALDWNGDAVEAKGFAYLAVRSELGLPLTLPTTTGVSEPMTGGKLYKSSFASDTNSSSGALRAATTK